MLVETDTHNCGQLHAMLNALHIHNTVVCFSDTDEATHYLKRHHKDVFLVLQNVASPGLQLPDSRNMVYMHEKFNVPEVAYMFLIHPRNTEGENHHHTFVHCYYREGNTEKLMRLFQSVIEYWQEHLFPALPDSVKLGRKLY